MVTTVLFFSKNGTDVHRNDLSVPPRVRQIEKCVLTCYLKTLLSSFKKTPWKGLSLFLYVMFYF